MLIDPDRDGCTIWLQDMVTHIRGNPDECIKKINEFYMKRHIDLTKYEEPLISIDVTGLGRYWADMLDTMGIKYFEIRGRNFI